MGTVGLWSSMRSKRTAQAVIGTYLFIFLWYVALSTGVFFVHFLSQSWSISPQVLEWLVMGGGSVLTVLFLFIQVFRRARFPELQTSRFRERRELKRVRLGGKPRPPARTWITRTVLAPAQGGIPDGWNPMFVASVRSEVHGRARSRRSIFLGVGAIVVLVWVIMGITAFGPIGDGLLIAACVVILVTSVLILPGASAASIAGERELGKLDFLRSTLLNPGQVLLGKLGACLFGGSGLLALGVLFCIIGIPFHSHSGGDDCRWLKITCSFLGSAAVLAVGASATGLLASTLTRTSVTGMVLAYAMWVGGVLFLPWLCSVFFVRGSMEYLSYLSPFFAFISTSLRDYQDLTVLGVSLVASLGVSVLELFLAALLFQRRWLREA